LSTQTTLDNQPTMLHSMLHRGERLTDIFKGDVGEKRRDLCLILRERGDELLNQKQLAELLHVSRQTVARYTETLEEKGLIAIDRSGISNKYELTIKGHDVVESMLHGLRVFDSGSSVIYENIRSHNIMFICKIIRFPHNKNAFEQEIYVQKHLEKKVKLKNWDKYIGYIRRGHDQIGSYYFTTRSFVITINEVVCSDPFVGVYKALSLAREQIEILETYELFCGLKIGIPRLEWQEQALTRELWAEMYKYGCVRYDNGTVCVDWSKNIFSEFEFKGQNADQLARNYINFAEGVAEEGLDAHEVAAATQKAPVFEKEIELIKKSITDLGHATSQQLKKLQEVTEKTTYALTEIVKTQEGYLMKELSLENKVNQLAQELLKEKMDIIKKDDKAFQLICEAIERSEKPNIKNIYKILKRKISFSTLRQLLKMYVDLGWITHKNGKYFICDDS